MYIYILTQQVLWVNTKMCYFTNKGTSVYFLATGDIPTNCDFENGFCGMIQPQNDDLEWTIHSGDTSSSDTGPTGDHTPGTSGTGMKHLGYT